MANRNGSRRNGRRRGRDGNGGEPHQIASSAARVLTSNLGVPLSDDQNSLRIGGRGPGLLEDFLLREKITHFDHERIPERIVHARGSGAHGYFQPYEPLSRLTKAAFLQDPKKKTPVFVRFSTVAGGAGSVDLPRDVRGFAVKFYTEEGNFDLVGNNIPVFFIQDAMKFPDLVHSVKMEPDRAFPQNASAHDTFWDFVSLMPESMHMLMWVMSDRAIPRSLRMIEGFGVNTFRFVNARGLSNFVKFHWRPLLGAASVLWDEAVKINGADQDFHRRDLWTAIDQGNYPEFEFAVQVVGEDEANELPFDILDATKLIPEEMVPLQRIGKMVLNRNPDNFFAETEQVAFCPANIVPGIEFSNDPLLQGRLFSYLDTQLIRLGGPNFHEIEINRPKCPMRNFQRDGHMRIEVPKGRVAYEPNSLDPTGPRECPKRGFASVAAEESGAKSRLRAESFADHYSQARLFWRSMTEPEQRHIVAAFAFELGKVETVAIRRRMLGHLALIEDELRRRVEEKLGMQGQAEAIDPARPPIEMDPSPALSIVRKAEKTLKGRKVGVLVSRDSDRTLVDRLRTAVDREGGQVEIVAPEIGAAPGNNGKTMADHALAAAPSIFFDAVVVAVGSEAVPRLAAHSGAIDWVRDAFAHLKVIGYVRAALPLIERADIAIDDGVLELCNPKDLGSFISAARAGRKWERERDIEQRIEGKAARRKPAMSRDEDAAFDRA